MEPVLRHLPGQDRTEYVTRMETRVGELEVEIGQVRLKCREAETSLTSMTASVGEANRQERRQFTIRYQLAMGQVSAAVAQ